MVPCQYSAAFPQIFQQTLHRNMLQRKTRNLTKSLSHHNINFITSVCVCVCVCVCMCVCLCVCVVVGAHHVKDTTADVGKHQQLLLLSSLPFPSKRRVTQSRRMRWAGHVAHMGKMRGVHRVLVGKHEGKRPIGRPRHRWEDNIKADPQ